MDYPERPEADFTFSRDSISFPATTDLELRGFTTCASCGQIHMLDMSHVKVIYVDGVQDEEHFCSTNCKNVWSITQLYKGGL